MITTPFENKHYNTINTPKTPIMKYEPGTRLVILEESGILRRWRSPNSPCIENSIFFPNSGGHHKTTDPYDDHTGLVGQTSDGNGNEYDWEEQRQHDATDGELGHEARLP